MPIDPGISKTIASQLLQIKAIRLQPDNPFTWASGWKSPIYCDNRIALSFPKVRTYIRQALTELILSEYGKPDVIAAVATAAIAQGALVAEAMELPFVYVRASAKDHGRKNLIEGEINANQTVVVIEDLISTGKSSLNAVEALRETGCRVKGLVSIFTYGFDEAKQLFESAQCRVASLCDYPVLLSHAIASGYIKENELSMLEQWRMMPDRWQQENKQVER